MEKSASTCLEGYIVNDVSVTSHYPKRIIRSWEQKSSTTTDGCRAHR